MIMHDLTELGLLRSIWKITVLERMEWPARSPDLNPIEHLWDYLGREVAALNPPPRSLHELKQGLLCVWSSLPIPVSDNLINSMGNRCRQCIQSRSSSTNFAFRASTWIICVHSFGHIGLRHTNVLPLAKWINEEF
ncbi:DDE_3 domain-containing protein [Trichonephila clavipes]|nr:DDE_3 domain-containing protein [Trichonephila clavipes]